MKSSSPRVSATSVVATFSPFHLKGNGDARGSFSRSTGSEASRETEVSPEGVSHSVSETDEALLVFNHEVACVEVHVSLLEHISHQLLLGQTFAARVTKKRAEGADL